MSTPPQQRTVCVLGFHRSGTSLTARAVNVLGADLGAETDLLPAHEADNARGYWEPRWMTELNDELLAALGTTWWQPFPGGPGWEDAPELADLHAQATARYREKLGAAALVGWKDPRGTLTLPFWQTIMTDPRYVICVRNPVDAIASIQRRPDPTLPTRAWGELWLEYTARAFQATAGTPRVVLFYDDVMREPATQFARVAALLELPQDDARIAAASALVDADLRHHRSSPVEVAAAPGLSAPVRTAFLALRAAQRLRGADDDEDARRIVEAVERIVVDAWLASRDADATQARADQVEAHAAGLAEALERAHAVSDGAHARLHELDARIGQLDARIGELDAQLADADRARADAEREHERLRATLAELEASASWRLTVPLRAVKRRVLRSRSA